MKTKRKAFIIGVLTVAFLAVVGFWLFAPRVAEVEAQQIAIAPAERLLAVNGRIRPRLQVDVRPINGGEIIALPFDVGDRVTAGAVLARIDDGPEQASIAEAEAAVQTQQATLAQARRDLSRFEALGQFATKREVEERRLAVVEGERELKRRQASVLQAREVQDRRVLRAPFSGIILERPVDLGQIVGADSIIYRLADLSRPEVTVEVDEVYAAEIRPDMNAVVSFPGQQRPITARVIHVEPRVDPTTGARDVRLDLGDAAMDAPAGLTVTVNIAIDRKERAISIPRSAIVGAGGAASVRVIGEDGLVADRRISFVDWPAQNVMVTSGLKVGDRILTDPEAVKIGERVKVRAAT